MNYLLVGSYALNSRLGVVREPKDLDIICTLSYFKSCVAGYKEDNQLTSCYPTSGNKWVVKLNDGRIEEYEIAYGKNTSSDLILKAELGTASLDMLYMLKMSHRYLRNSPAFLKTMEDIHLIRKNGVEEVSNDLMEIYKLRMKETYNYKHPTLKTSKKEFFSGDGIDYKYDHDSIHLAVAEMDVPAYDLIKSSKEEVFCSKEQFWSARWEIKLLTVIEEAMVLAIERSLVPHPNVLTPEKAFELALMKVCTSITSGWWREYAWENYYNVKKYFYHRRSTGWKYEEQFEKGLREGVVLPFNNVGEQ